MFSARGFDAVGVQEIAEACSLGKPTLYHYFGNKQGLLETIIDEEFSVLRAKVMQAAEYKRDITANLQDLAKAFFEYAKDNRDLYRMQLTMYLSPPENPVHGIVYKYNKELHDILETLFRNAVSDHGNMKGKDRIYAATFMGMINTYIGLYLNGYVEFSEVLVYGIVKQFMHGIFS